MKQKLLTAVLSLFIGISSQAQKNPEHSELQKTIETFFEGFHEQDSVMVRSVMTDSVVLQSIGKTKEGEIVIHNEVFGNFLKSITSIPSANTFKEELHAFEIRVDGNMANVWTPYTFYFNGKLSHCGVNSFQLLKEEGKWKIFYLVDTRRREGCNAIAGKEESGKWDDAMLRFEAEDKTAKPEPGVILFTGSSSIAMWDEIEQDFPEHNILNRGFGGSQFSDLLEYSEKVIYLYKPSKIFIYEGDNDLAAGETVESILKEVQQLREEIKKKLPNTAVIFISPKPSLSRWNLKRQYEALNEAMAEYAATTELTEFADVWSPMLNDKGLVKDEYFVEDGLHMNEQGYAVWKQVLLPYLRD